MTTGARPGPHNDLTDVAGIAVGHFHRIGRGWLTGTTVVRCPANTVAGVDVRGGAPGTRETDLLAPTTMMPSIQAVTLTGGSAYGLAAADGVMTWLAERNEGFRVGPDRHHVVPIVPTAVLFDLGRGGSFANRPDASFGRRAIAAARATPFAQGCVGAGAGAVTGGLKGGVGSASVVLADGITVAALAVVNALGGTVDPDAGLPYGAPDLLRGELRLRKPSRADIKRAGELADAASAAGPRPLNTTVVVVATNAPLTKAECSKLAAGGQNGLARAIRPVHTMGDGDVVFGLATGRQPFVLQDDAARWPGADLRMPSLNAVLGAAADVVSRAVVHAMVHATSIGGFDSYRDRFPSAFTARR
jgi:L-aminopeptidase/D-esterase-like protein